MTLPLFTNAFGQVTSLTLNDNMQGLLIKHDKCQASISLYGGQVLTWQPKGQKDVFWLSKEALYQEGKVIRGGIPLCWPWFGAHWYDRDNKAGNHGFARQKNWQIDTININAEQVIIVLTLSVEQQHRLWPNKGLLKQYLTFGECFSQRLEMTNLSDDMAQYTGALHSYFSVSDPKNITIDNLSQLSFIDKLTGVEHINKKFIHGEGPVDRIYQASKADQVMQIVDSTWQRIIEIQSKNSQQWVFWNPGREIAQNMTDVHKNAEQEFICLEAANTEPTNLPSKKSITLEQTIRILPL
jgi:glucose-6-phosphate 1-epimerase